MPRATTAMTVPAAHAETPSDAASAERDVAPGGAEPQQGPGQAEHQAVREGDPDTTPHPGADHGQADLPPEEGFVRLEQGRGRAAGT